MINMIEQINSNIETLTTEYLKSSLTNRIFSAIPSASLMSVLLYLSTIHPIFIVVTLCFLFFPIWSYTFMYEKTYNYLISPYTKWSNIICGGLYSIIVILVALKLNANIVLKTLILINFLILIVNVFRANLNNK